MFLCILGLLFKIISEGAALSLKIIYILLKTFDRIGEIITVANCHFTMYNIKYVLLDYIVLYMLGGSRGNLGCLMTQVLVIMFQIEVMSDIL